MKYRLLTLVLTLAVLFAFDTSASRAAEMAELKGTFDKYGISVSESDLLLVKDVYDFWKKRGDGIWPGMKPETTPLVIVFPEKHNLVIGHDGTITGAVALADKLPVLDKKAFLVKDDTFMNGAMASPDYNGRPTVFFNTIETTDRFIRDYAKKNGIASHENYRTDPLDHMGKILHELFHAYQYSEQKLGTAKKKKNKAVRLTKIDYPYLDADIALLLGIEGRILARVIETADAAEAGKLFDDFIAARRFRHSRLDPDIVRLEEYMEVSEGTAQYVGWMINYASTTEAGIFDNLKKLPEFKDVRASGSPGGAAGKFLAELHSPMMGRYMNYVYYTGLAQTCALNGIKPGWSEGFFRKRGKFGDIVKGARTYPGDEASFIRVIGKKYGADEMRTKIADALGKLKEENRLKFKKFESLPGRKFRIVFEGAGPADILIYAPVLLTEYGNIRIFEAGCNRIERVDAGLKALARIDFKAAFPVFFDRRSGAVSFRIENPEHRGFEVRSGSKREKKGRVTYENDVELTSGAFSFRASRIDVTTLDGDEVRIVVKK